MTIERTAIIEARLQEIQQQLGNYRRYLEDDAGQIIAMLLDKTNDMAWSLKTLRNEYEMLAIEYRKALDSTPKAERAANAKLRKANLALRARISELEANRVSISICPRCGEVRQGDILDDEVE